MELGAFSISLTVKDIQASKDFYEKFGFVSLVDDELHLFLPMASIEQAFSGPSGAAP